MEQAKTVSRTLDPSAVPGRRIFEACTLTYCSTRGGHRERSGASVLTTSTLHDSILLQFCSVEFLLVLGSFARVPSAVSALVSFAIPLCFCESSFLFFLSFPFPFHVHQLCRFRRVQVRASFSSSRSPRPTTVQRPLQIARIALSEFESGAWYRTAPRTEPFSPSSPPPPPPLRLTPRE